MDVRPEPSEKKGTDEDRYQSRPSDSTPSDDLEFPRGRHPVPRRPRGVV